MNVRIAVTGLLGTLLMPLGAAAQDVADVETAEVVAVELVEAGPHPDLTQDYEPDPALWVLSDHDTTIYLLGTYHALPPGFEWRTPLLDRIMKSVDELVLETSDADAAGQKQYTLTARIMDRPASGKAASIAARLSPEAREKWSMLARTTGIGETMLDRMPPLSIVFMLDGMGGDMSDFRDSLGVETILTRDFQRMGKPIGSIEDSVGVMTNLMAIDEALWIASLDEDLRDWDGEDIATLFSNGSHFGNDFATRRPDITGIAAENAFYSEHMWAKGYGDIDDMVFGDGELGRTFRRVLLEDRNRAWSFWLADRLERPGTLLVAVGSAHFGGADSVLAMLRERGLEAKRIN